MANNVEIPEDAVELATIAWYEATPGVSWADAGKYERAAMLSRSKLILEAALPHLRVQETPATDPLRAALERIKAELDKRSEEGEAHLFLNIPYWELEQLLAAHPAPHSRPVVDREALIWAMATPQERRVNVSAYLAARYGRQADAVLALLPDVVAQGGN